MASGVRAVTSEDTKLHFDMTRHVRFRETTSDNWICVECYEIDTGVLGGTLLNVQYPTCDG